MNQIKEADLLAEGKTKWVWGVEGDPTQVVLASKDDITAGDGKKHDVLPGKGALANRTTSNVFRLLSRCGLPVAFIRQITQSSFLAHNCTMYPYEVVVRREAHGSYLKRRPELSQGHVFPQLLVEFFLKTSGKNWEGTALPVDDPLIHFEEDEAYLFLPGAQIHGQEPFLTLFDFPLRDAPELRKRMGELALQTFLILEKAWQLAGGRLVDFKVEFGMTPGGELVLADVIDNDSWRVVDDGGYMDKQVYRDDGDLNEVMAKYRRVAELTDSFGLPRQQLILWRASEKDDLTAFENAISYYGAEKVCVISEITFSLHKQVIQACQTIGLLVQEVPDSVAVVFVGRSNGAGPTLSAQVTVPVITVPATTKEFPEDVWSSLRTPSQTPVMTVLDPGNAVLAALQILAMRNPLLYANLRMKQEERLVNIMSL